MQAARGVTGLAALVAFFLPWVEGAGPLAGVTFSGYELVGYTGALRQLESLDGATLSAVQAGVLFTAVASVWLAILGAVGRWQGLRMACL
jgi:hypothetical protein